MLSKVQLAVTGNRGDKDIGNSKLADFGISDQKVKIEKIGNKMQANIFGITANTYYSTTRLFSFANQFAQASKIYAENMALQMSIEEYKKFIKQVDKVKEVYTGYSEEEIKAVREYGIQDLTKPKKRQIKYAGNIMGPVPANRNNEGGQDMQIIPESSRSMTAHELENQRSK